MEKPNDQPLYPRRTNADRRRDVIRLLEQHPEYSDRRIAFIAVAARETVTLIRSNLVRKRQIPAMPKRIGADGKIYGRLPSSRSRATNSQ